MTRRLALVIFPDFQLLDAAGPIAAFEIAERYHPGSYDLSVQAPGGGQVSEFVGCLRRSRASGRRTVRHRDGLRRRRDAVAWRT